MKDIPLYDVRRICDLKDMLAASVERFGDNPAFLRKKEPAAAYEPVSFRQFQSDVNAFGTALLALGQQGRRIAVICENLMAVMSTVRLVPGDIALSVLPIHHTYECT